MRKASSFAKANFQKGFTLIEVLLITVLLAILGLAALSAFTDSSGTFTFLKNYKNITASLRSTRVFAITNKIEGADRYGVYLTQEANGAVPDENIIQVTSFADTGATSFAFDPTDDVMPSDTYTISGNYDMRLQNAATSGLPLLIFYDAGGEKMTIISDGDILPSETTPIVAIQFLDNENGHEKYLGIFQVSGLIEEFNEPPL